MGPIIRLPNAASGCVKTYAIRDARLLDYPESVPHTADRLTAFCMLSGQSPHSARPRSFVSEVVTGVRPTHPHCWPTVLACVHPLRRPGTSLGLFGIQSQHRVSCPGQHRIGHTHLRHSEHRSRSSSRLLQLSHRHQRLQCGVDGIGESSGGEAPSRQALPSRKNSLSPQASASMPLVRAWDSMRLARIGSAVSNDTWRSISSGNGSDTVTPPWALCSFRSSPSTRVLSVEVVAPLSSDSEDTVI